MTEEFGRIDLFENPQGYILVLKWRKGWAPGAPPCANDQNTEMDLDEMVDWLEREGWTIRRWPGGARAWRDGLRIIRTRGQILRKRKQLQTGAGYGPEIRNIAHTLELAYDL